MSKGWAPDTCLKCHRAAAWLRKAGLFSVNRTKDLMGRTRGDLWNCWIERGCPLGGDSTRLQQLAVYRRLKAMLAGTKAPHPSAMLKLAAVELGDTPATRSSINPLLGVASKEDIATVCRMQGLKPRKPPRPSRSGTVEELIAVLPLKRQVAFRKTFAEAARRGAVISARHIGRVLNLSRELQPLGAMMLLDWSWQGKAPATAQAYLHALEGVDDLWAKSKATRIDRFLCALNRSREELDEGTKVATRNFAIALGSARTFTVERFGSAAAVRLFLELPDPGDLRELAAQAALVIDARNDRKGLEREDQVLFDFEQNDDADLRVKQRQALVEAIYEGYRDALKRMGTKPPKGGFLFFVRTPVFDESGASIQGAEQYVHFRIESAAAVARRAIAKNREGSTKHRSATVAQLGARSRRRAALLREDLLVLYDGVTPDKEGGPTVEPFFVELYRWGVLEGGTRHPPYVQACRALLIDNAALKGAWNSVRDLLALPEHLRWIQKMSRGDNPDEGEVILPVVALHHGTLLGTLAHSIARQACPRSYELLQVQLGPVFIKKKLFDASRFNLWMRPKWQNVLQPYEVNKEVLALISKIVKLVVARWRPELDGKTLRLPVWPARLSQNKPLPDGEYVFTNSAGMLHRDEFQLLRHFVLWQVSTNKIQDERFILTSKFGRAGVPERMQAKLLKHSPSSKQTRHYNRAPGLQARSDAKDFANGQRDLP